MPRLTIDGRTVEVAAGATLLQAAEAVGIRIPTLCYREGLPAATSCSVCVVKVGGRRGLVPSCATRAEEGMVVESETEEVRSARRTALELLLSDHAGDCMGPCQSVCPAHMDIPRMVRLIGAGRFHEALVTVKERIALPAVLGRICPELCEKGCRRAQADGAVSICALKRFVADHDLASGSPYLPNCRPPTGKRVAVVGTGPAGLAAAYTLLQEGHACVLLDRREEPGGALRYAVPEDRLPREVLDAEIKILRSLGAELRLGCPAAPVSSLASEFDAVLAAVGEVTPEAAQALGLEMEGRGLRVDRHSQMTETPGVFAAGAAVTPTRHAVRSLASGRAAAVAVSRWLAGEPASAEERSFSVHLGRLAQPELSRFLQIGSAERRSSPGEGAASGFSAEEAEREARRCLECGCSASRDCRLRLFSREYGADPARFRGERRAFEREESHPFVLYEPGKCISCGLCIRIAEESREALGLTFVGRGFDVRVGVPFGGTLSEGLREAARRCAEACPTGALTLRPEACPAADSAAAPATDGPPRGT